MRYLAAAIWMVVLYQILVTSFIQASAQSRCQWQTECWVTWNGEKICRAVCK